MHIYNIQVSQGHCDELEKLGSSKHSVEILNFDVSDNDNFNFEC